MEAANDSSVKDGSKEAAAVMSVSDVAGSISTTDREAVVKALDSNPDLYQRVLTMSAEELAQLDEQLKAKQTVPVKDEPHANPEAPAPDKPAAEAGQASSASKDEGEEELVVKLKPKDLGTYYSKGRSPQEAILELVKGKKNADDRIKYLKDDQMPALERMARTLSEENQALKTDLAKLTAEKEASAKKAAPEEPVTDDVTLPNPEEIDFFDPDTQKNIVDKFKKIKEDNAALKSQIETLKKVPPAQSAAPKSEAVPQARNAEVENEFNEIRLLQRNPDTEGLFSTKVDVEAVEKQNIAFMESLARANGVNSIYDASGRINQATATLLDTYYANTPESQALRQASDAAGIKPPEDLPALNRIYAIRSLRQQYYKPNVITGKVEPIPYEEAHRLARSVMPDLFAQKTPSDIRNSEREAISRGVEQRSTFAPDPKSSSSSEMSMAANMNITEFMRLMKKDTKDYTPAEIDLLRKIYKDEGKMSDDEIESLLKPGG